VNALVQYKEVLIWIPKFFTHIVVIKRTSLLSTDWRCCL